MALTIATILVGETGGDGELMTGEFFNYHFTRGTQENSRWNEGEISAGAAARTCRILQSRLDGSTVFAVEKAGSCSVRDIRNA